MAFKYCVRQTIIVFYNFISYAKFMALGSVYTILDYNRLLKTCNQLIMFALIYFHLLKQEYDNISLLFQKIYKRNRKHAKYPTLWQYLWNSNATILIWLLIKINE